jgi:hypothetical protein
MTRSLEPELWNDERARVKKSATKRADVESWGGIECSVTEPSSDDGMVNLALG